MSNVPDSAAAGDSSADAADTERDSPALSKLKISESTILMGVADDVVVLFGEIPESVEFLDLGLIPEYGRTQLSRALDPIRNADMIVDNIVETVTSAQGLSRLNEAAFLLLRSGGELAAKDGAKLGVILKNGKAIARARFIPVSVAATTVLTAIGPAAVMVALQAQLGEISSFVQINIALIAQTLKTIRNEQWSELEGLADSIDGVSRKVREIGTLVDTLWESTALMGQLTRKQARLYRKNAISHIQEIRKSDRHTKGQYLESNAETIVFETYALLASLRTRATYQALVAVRARKRGETDGNEAKLSEIITHDASPEIKDSREEIGQLTESLVHGLRIIAELPGGATMSLTKERRDAKAAKLTCARLLEAIKPLAELLHSAVAVPAAPEMACAPDDLDLDPCLRVLRWFLEDGEQLHGIAFPYEVSANNFPGKLPVAALSKLLDAAWDALKSSKMQALAPETISNTSVAVTDHRIITANPRELLHCDELDTTYPLDDVEGVHLRTDNTDHVCPVISATTRRSDIRWMFPARANQINIDSLTTMTDDLVAAATESASDHAETRAAIASSATETASS